MCRRTRLLYTAPLLAALGLWTACPAGAQSVIFDFDTGVPALTTGRNIPLDQTSGGIVAHFSSPTGAVFSVQTDASTGWKMSQFSGHYLTANNIGGNVLDITFSQWVTGITLTFATADFQQVEIPSTIQATAYLDSTGTPAVGSASAHGSYASDTMPMGTLSFSSGGQLFNVVEIAIPYQPLAAAAFCIDNVTVATLASVAFSSASAASYASGALLAPASIASGFGESLASGTESAASQPPPLTLANTVVTVRDSGGVNRQAPLYYVGPTQINYVLPDGTAAGPVTLAVTSGGQLTAVGAASIASVAPGLFTANADGKGAPAAAAITVAPDQTQTVQAVARCGLAPGSCVTSPIDLGPSGFQVVLTLYGTGIRGRTALTAVTATVGGLDAQVQYAGAQSQFAGLDQVNVAVPRALAGRGEVDLALVVDGIAANTVRVNIK